MHDDLSFMRDISLITRRMRTYAERSMAEHGLGFPEQAVIMQLCAQGTSNQESVARHFAVDKGAIAKTVSKLEQKGLITRTVNPQNKREKLLSLTPAADEVVADMKQAYEQLSKTMFAGLSAEDAARLSCDLARVAQNLSDVDEGEVR